MTKANLFKPLKVRDRNLINNTGCLPELEIEPKSSNGK